MARDKDVKTMSRDELQAEFRALAKQLSPINARRSVISKEMESRVGTDNFNIKLKHFFSGKEDRRKVLQILKAEFGEE